MDNPPPFCKSQPLQGSDGCTAERSKNIRHSRDNHIIINSVNFMNGKSFRTEHDDKNKNPAWKVKRKISDN